MSLLQEAFGVDCLPTAWREVPLAAVARERKGNKNTGMQEDNLLSLSFGNIVRKDIDGTGGLLPESFDGYQIVEPGDLVMRLTDLQNDKRSLRSGLCSERGIITSAYLALQPTGLDPRYFAYLMRAYDVAKVLYPLGGGLRQSIGFEDIRRLPIVVPPIEEQRRIADFLDDQVGRIDQAIIGMREMFDISSKRASALVLDSLGADVGSSTTPAFPGDLVTGSPWPLVRLSLLAKLGTGHTPSRSVAEYWRDCDIPWLTTSDIHLFRNQECDVLEDSTHHVSELGLANSAAVIHPTGTIALSRTASVGFSIRMGVPMSTSQDFVTWTCGPRLNPDYLLTVLRATREDFVSRLSYGSTHKTIYFPDLMSLRIPLPPVDEQRRVVLAAAQSREWERKARSQSEKGFRLLEERKRSIITAAVTGQMDVTAARPLTGPWVSNSFSASVESPGYTAGLVL